MENDTDTEEAAYCALGNGEKPFIWWVYFLFDDFQRINKKMCIKKCMENKTDINSMRRFYLVFPILLPNKISAKYHQTDKQINADGEEFGSSFNTKKY